MAIVITLPQPEDRQELAQASGAPRPLPPALIEPVPAGAAALPPLQLLPPYPAPVPPPESAIPGGDGAPGQANWRSDPDDDERVSVIARSVAQAALEVLAGTRPLQQMARWLGPENYERMQLRTSMALRRRAAEDRRRAAAGIGDRARRGVCIRSFRVCPVAEGKYEACVVAFEQSGGTAGPAGRTEARGRAIALRIELRRGLWKVTELEIG